MAKQKPRIATEYSEQHSELVRQTCLYVATKVGDLIDDIVVVGGIVPLLLIDQENLPEGAEAHVGTQDLDLGLKVALLDEERYRDLALRLREADFAPETNEKGNKSRQTWKLKGTNVTIDFLIPPTLKSDKPGKLRDLEVDFAAFIAPGLELAFIDRVEIRLDGVTVRGERCARNIWVCGPGAYVVLKALALRSRGANKDAYDLFYFVRNYGSGVEDIAKKLKPLAKENKTVQKALTYLSEDFEGPDSIGPRRVSEFLAWGEGDAELRAEALGFITELLRLVKD